MTYDPKWQIPGIQQSISTHEDLIKGWHQYLREEHTPESIKIVRGIISDHKEIISNAKREIKFIQS